MWPTALDIGRGWWRFARKGGVKRDGLFLLRWASKDVKCGNLSAFWSFAHTFGNIIWGAFSEWYALEE
jgi:hypothetical protein